MKLRECIITVSDIEFQNAVFHCWGDIQVGNGDILTYGIVEDETGQVRIIEPNRIQFKTPQRQQIK